MRYNRDKFLVKKIINYKYYFNIIKFFIFMNMILKIKQYYIKSIIKNHLNKILYIKCWILIKKYYFLNIIWIHINIKIIIIMDILI